MRDRVKLSDRVVAGLLRPQGLIGLLVFAVGVVMLLTVSGQVRVPRPEPIILEEAPSAELDRQEVELVVVNAEGQARSLIREVALPEFEGPNAEAARIGAILGDLKVVLTEGGVWPAGLELPTVFVVERFNRKVAVLDFTVDDEVAATIAQERRTLESVRGTLQGNGVDAVNVLVEGRAAETFLGHVALDAELP